MDSPTATRTPVSTPRASTATIVATASISSLRRKCGEPPELTDVDQPERRVHDDRAQRRGREARQQRAAGTANATTTEASATRECSCERLPSASPITVRLPLLLTGKPWVQPTARLVTPERQQLLVRIDPVAVADGEGAGGQHVVHVGRRSSRRAPGPSRSDRSAIPTAGTVDVGQAARDVADEPHPAVLEGQRQRPPPPRPASRSAVRGARGKRRWTTRRRTRTPAASSVVAGCSWSRPRTNDASSAIDAVARHRHPGDLARAGSRS